MAQVHQNISLEQSVSEFDDLKQDAPESLRKDSGIDNDDTCTFEDDEGHDLQGPTIPATEDLPPTEENSLNRSSSVESVGEILEEVDETGSSSGSGEERDEDNSEEIHCERSSSVVSDASEEGGRDSGIEAEREADMVIPDRDTMDKIVTQVEFYFSDANVVKDKFLLKHIRRNKEGYVSLKLVSSFKKVKQITKDWRVVAYALSKSSSNIQINDEGSKIRRVQPLPEIDDSPVTCAVLALDMPLEAPTIQNVSQLFSSSNEISFIRVLRAGGILPPDVKSYLTKFPELGQKHCAWVEFETPEAAKEATKTVDQGSMRVVLIVPESQKKQEKQKQQLLQQQTSNRRQSLNIKTSFGREKMLANARKGSFSKYRNDGNQDRRPQMQRRKAISLPQSQLPNIAELSGQGHYKRPIRPKSKSCVEFSGSGAPSTSWVQRHLLAAAAASAASAAAPTANGRSPPTRTTRLSSGSLPLPEGVSRFPKGPDGSKGFSRMRPVIGVNERTM